MTEEQLQAGREKYGITQEMIDKAKSTSNNVSLNQSSESGEDRQAYFNSLVSTNDKVKPEKRNILQKADDFFTSGRAFESASNIAGTQKLGEAMGTTIATLTADKEEQQAYQTRQNQLNELIQEQYQEATKIGDTEGANKLLKMLQDQGQTPNVMEAMTEDAPTTGQIIGSGLRTAGGLITISAVGKNLIQNALINAGEGAISGALEGAGMALEESKNMEDLLRDSLKYAGLGALLGGGITLAAGAVGSGIRKFATSKATKTGTVITPKIGVDGVDGGFGTGPHIAKTGTAITPKIGVETGEELIKETAGTSPHIAKTYSALDDFTGKASKDVTGRFAIESGITIKANIVDEMSELLEEQAKNVKIDNSPKIISLRRELDEVTDIFDNPLNQTNQYIKKAKKLGLGEAELNTIARGTADEQALKKQILSLSELQTKSPSSTRIAETIPAKEIMKIDNFIESKVKDVSKVVSKNLDNMPDQLYRFDDAFDGFSKQIDDLNITEVDGKLVFNKSILKNDTSGQKLINDLYEEFVENGGKFTPKEVDTIRKRIGSELNLFSKKVDLSDEANRILYSARKALLDGLDEIDPVFRQNNRNLSMLLGAEQDFQNKFLGKDFTFAKTANKAEKIGQVARRMQGNASSAYNNVFDTMQGTAEYFGYDTNGVNIRRLFDFTDLVNTQNKVLQKTGFSGQVNKGIGLSDTSNLLRAATSTRGKIDLAIQQAQKLGGDFDLKKKAAIIELLDNYSQAPVFSTDIPQATILKTVQK